MTDQLHMNDRCVTVHNKCSKIPPSMSVHFAIRVWSGVFFVWVDLHVFLTQAAAPKMRDGGSSGLSTFILPTSHFIQTHKQNFSASEKREGRTVHAELKYLHLGNNLASDIYICMYVCMNFPFSKWSTLLPPTTLTYPPESPCIFLSFVLQQMANFFGCHFQFSDKRPNKGAS
jgi:hypothetical protein